MNREEAQSVLRAYRPSGEDAADPQFQEALALVRSDAELARWFADEQTLDAAIAEKIHDFPPPPHLTSQLLLARKVIRPRPWWHKPAWAAAAASVALLIAAITFLLLLQRNSERQLASFRNTMIEAHLDKSNHLAVTGLDTKELKQWLIQHRGDPAFVLPAGLGEKGFKGCKVLDWQGHEVTLLCLKFGANHVDIFVINEADLPRTFLRTAPAFASGRGMTTATWRREGKIYFLAGDVPESDLKRLL